GADGRVVRARAHEPRLDGVRRGADRRGEARSEPARRAPPRRGAPGRPRDNAARRARRALGCAAVRRLETRLEGPVLIEPTVHGDERGFFAETYRRSAFEELGIRGEMVQDNHSRSRRGIVRGMHFQVGQGAAKLVRVSRGAIYDALVDVRRGSPTFGQWEGFELSEDNMRMLYCPIGFAHGFCVVSEITDVMYKQSN